MVYPGIPVESTSRSSLEAPACQAPSSTPSILLPQQQLIYTSYSTYAAPQVQSFPTVDSRRHPVNNNQHFSLRTQDYRNLKATKWHQKPRPRYKDYQVPLQQPLPYTPTPVVVYDPLQTHVASPSLNPVYLSQTPACYSQPCPTETYAYSSPVVPQSYYKPPDAQQYCVIHDRQIQDIRQLSYQAPQASYYSAAAGYNRSRYYGSSTGFPSLSSSSQSTSFFNSSEKIACLPAKSSREDILHPLGAPAASENRANSFQVNEDRATLSTEPHLTGAKQPLEDKFFDESCNFDFTIEAEKMVSALCNTTSSNDLDKDDEIPTSSAPVKSEDPSKAYKPWYLEDYSSKTFQSVETQTCTPEDPHCPELLRRAMYAGCSEMEAILKTSNPTYRRSWLLSLSSATRVALSKSSTCFPMYLSDKAFAQDLMNAFLRIGNGWLALDNYLNKQPNLALSQKYDKELQKSFKLWEASTVNLLSHMTRSFKKLDAASEDTAQDSPSQTSSFPGDVSLYVNYNLLGNGPAPTQTSQILKSRNVYQPEKHRWLSVARESKVRTKWTITENTRNLKDLPVQQLQTLLPQKSESSVETTMSIWSPCLPALNQMETKKVENPEGETINLSAWFASMRTRPEDQNFWETRSSPPAREGSKSSVDVVGTSRMDANRQLKTLKHMRMIQSAPWTANQILDDQAPAKGGTTELGKDGKVYMKPGSYNVPRKKYHSKRSARRTDSSGSRASCPQAAQVPQPPAAFLEDARRPEASQNELLDRASPSVSSSSSTCSRDVTWKAACASAELLLDALNVQKKSKTFKKRPKNRKGEKKRISSSSSEGESASRRVKLNRGHQRTVKTDSWLIKTFNNAKASPSEEPRKEDDELQPKGDVDRSYSLETSHTIAVMTLVDVVGKATYSETLRRFSTSTKPSSSKAILQKSGETDRSRAEPICSVAEASGGDKVDSQKVGKRRKGKGTDRGWSVWYSSRRKQQSSALEPVELDKLLSIHRALWRMDATRIFKFPTGVSRDSDTTSNIDNYRKVIKTPVFLETIGYKLKNHVYRKVEHVIRDFRKIVHNSRVYHKNDKQRTERIEALSQRFEELVSQHFDGLQNSTTGRPKTPDSKEPTASSRKK